MPRKIRKLEGSTLFLDSLPIHVNRTEENIYLEQHTHDFIEIIYVEEGSGFHYIEEEQVRVSRGDVFYLPLGASHVFRPSGQPPSPKLVVYNCVIDAQYLQRLQQFHGLRLPFDPLLDEDERSEKWYVFRDREEEIGGLFRRMAEEYQRKGQDCLIALTAWLMLLHVRLFPSQPVSAIESHGKPSLHDDALDRALRWLADNLDRSATMENAAAAAGLSVRHFDRLFKQRTGMPFLAYLQNKRIQRAILLLETTALQVAEIAAFVGYKDAQSFYRVFRKIAGQTPGAYRRSRKK